MTDTPDKEWIERAAKVAFGAYVGIKEAAELDAQWADIGEGSRAAWRRVVQSSFDQGVERERERVPTMIVSPPREWTQEVQSLYEAEMERKREQRVLAGAKFYARASAQRAVNGVIPEWDDEADEANWQHTRPDIREGAIDMVRAIIVACEFKQRQENAAARAIETLNSDAGRAALGEGKI